MLLPLTPQINVIIGIIFVSVLFCLLLLLYVSFQSEGSRHPTGFDYISLSLAYCKCYTANQAENIDMLCLRTLLA